MMSKLKCLYQNGVVLNPAELANAPRYSGKLIFEDKVEDGHVIHNARLVDTTTQNFLQDIVPPLFNVEVVNMTEGYLKIRGDQFDTISGIRFCRKQCWFLHTNEDK
jgi:hypothetical protein